MEMDTDAKENKYVLLLSGLNLGSSWSDQLSVELLMDYITGQLGGEEDQQLCSNIVRVIVAGNSVSDRPAKVSAAKETKTRFLSRNYTAETVEAVKELDTVLAQLASCVPVDLMPGSHDPGHAHLPQQPLHHCMFPRAAKHQTLRGVANPYEASLYGVRFLGCSGQNIEDIFRFSTLRDHLEILEDTLRWRHISPTSPDTLSCYPYTDHDPFIIEQCPQVYFAGNQPSFQHKTITGDNGQTTLLVSVPTFDLTHSCVLVGLAPLECRELSFSTSLQRPPNPDLQRLAELELSATAESSRADSDTTLLHLMESEDEED